MKTRSIPYLVLSMVLLVLTTGCLPPDEAPTARPLGIGGVVSGLEPGEEVQIDLWYGNNTDFQYRETLTLSENGRFWFNEKLTGTYSFGFGFEVLYDYSLYRVLVRQHPANKLCYQTAATPTPETARDINTLTVECEEPRIASLRAEVPDQYFAACVNWRARLTDASTYEEILQLYTCRNPEISVYVPYTGGLYDVRDLQGLERLTNLQTFSMGSPWISEVDLSANTQLWALYVNAGYVPSEIILPVGAPLEVLDLWYSHSANIDVDLTGYSELRDVSLNGRGIKSVSFAHPLPLESLDLVNTDITTIDLGGFDQLNRAYFWCNPFDEDTLSYLDSLTTIPYLRVTYSDSCPYR